MKFKIVDTSALLHSNLDYRGQKYLAPNSVILEVIDENAKAAVESAIKNRRLVVQDPSQKSVEKATAKARETGDLNSLSKTDLEVIALALEKNAVILSDDYAIQNTARQMGLKTEPAAQEGIKKTIKWAKVCEGCGKTYESGKTNLCTICGSKIKKKPDNLFI